VTSNRTGGGERKREERERAPTGRKFAYCCCHRPLGGLEGLGQSSHERETHCPPFSMFHLLPPPKKPKTKPNQDLDKLRALPPDDPRYKEIPPRYHQVKGDFLHVR
jgi:hypothetical protein